jgi:hypothetical protein
MLVQNYPTDAQACLYKKIDHACLSSLQLQEILGRTNLLLSLIRHRPHWKRRFQQFFYCCVCIRYRGNISTEPLPSNCKGMFIEPLPSNDKGIFTGPLPSNDWGGYTDTQTATWSQNHTLFFKNKESRLRVFVKLIITSSIIASLCSKEFSVFVT